MVELFKQKRIREARKLIIERARPDEYNDIYSWLYKNVDMFGDELAQDEAILKIRDGLVKHGQVADIEINLSATMVELSKIVG